MRRSDRLRDLQILAILVPALCAGIYETVRHSAFPGDLPFDLGTPLAVILVMTISFGFAHVSFGIIRRTEGHLRERNRELQLLSRRVERLAVLEERDRLAREIHDSVAQGLPKEALDPLRSIQATLGELLPRLQELRDRAIISGKDCFTVVETVRRYLPDTLAAYLRLPKLYAQVQTLAGGRTASQTLVEQLRVLDSSLKEIAKNAFAGDAEALLSNGRFL